jgi:hypothetical protein
MTSGGTTPAPLFIWTATSLVDAARCEFAKIAGMDERRRVAAGGFRAIR